MIGRRVILFLQRHASTAVKTKPKIDASAAVNSSSSATPAATGKMPPQRPVLTPIQKRQSPFEAQQLPFLSTDSVASNFPSQVSLPVAQLHNKLSKDLKVAADLFGANYLVWRGELMSKLAIFYGDHQSFLLSGQRGVGKSAILMQIFAALQQTGGDDLLLFAPDSDKWTTGYFAYYPTANGEFEQPELALEILQLLLWSNPNKKELPVTAEEIKEASKDPLSLALPLYSRVMTEIKASGRKLTILADEVNGLVDEGSLTGYNDVNGEVLPLRAFPLCRDFIKTGDRFIGALTLSNPLLPKQPKYSLPEFTIPAYSDAELTSVLQMYRKLGHLASNFAFDDQFVAMKAFLSGRNGRLLFKSCEYDSIYH